MNRKSPPRTLGQQISPLFSAVALACLLVACGGGGGGDTAAPATPSGNTPDQTATAVKIVSVTGCEVPENQKSCLIKAVVDASVPASVQVVGGVPVPVTVGAGTEVSLDSVQVGSNTVLASASGTTGTPAQATVTVQCAPGLTLDTTSSECRAPAPVVQTVNLVITGQWYNVYFATVDGLVEATNVTGKATVYNCMVPEDTEKVYTKKIPGLCSELTGGVASWLPVWYDPVSREMQLNPGGDTDRTKFKLAKSLFDQVSGLLKFDTVDPDGSAVTYIVPEDINNVTATGGDLIRRKNGVDRVERNVDDIFASGRINGVWAFKVQIN